MWLMTSLAGTVPDSALQPLQQSIEECDRGGGRDADVPAGEDLESFAAVVQGSCRTRDEVLRQLAPILRA